MNRRTISILAGTLGITTAAGITALAASHPDHETDGVQGIASLGFMTGSWVADHDGNRLEEHFSAPRDATMIGMFRWAGDGATRFTEHMVVEQRDDGVYFFLRHFNPGGVIWEHEKDGPMRFRLESVENARAVFANPDVQFPTRIVYHRTQPDALTVSLEGTGDSGASRHMEFTFRSLSMTTTTETLNEVGAGMGYDGGLTLAFSVKDIAKSIDFYQNVIGFKIQYHLEDMGWCELTTGVSGVNIGLSQVEDPKPGGPTPTFGVTDIDHARAQLEAKGVKFDGETREIPGMVKLATFYDVDGNTLMLYQTLSDQMP